MAARPSCRRARPRARDGRRRVEAARPVHAREELRLWAGAVTSSSHCPVCFIWRITNEIYRAVGVRMTLTSRVVRLAERLVAEQAHAEPLRNGGATASSALHRTTAPQRCCDREGGSCAPSARTRTCAGRTRWSSPPARKSRPRAAEGSLTGGGFGSGASPSAADRDPLVNGCTGQVRHDIVPAGPLTGPVGEGVREGAEAAVAVAA